MTGITEEQAKQNVAYEAERLDHDGSVDWRKIEVYYSDRDQLWHAHYRTGYY